MGWSSRSLLGLFGKRPRNGLEYWTERAERHGPRSVFNLGHSDEELAAVTRRQKEILFPALRSELRGDEKCILDFGCGTGRFTPDLAALIKGRAIGIDPIECLLGQAPRDPSVEYRPMIPGVIPIEDGSIDVVWSLIVLGCIVDDSVLLKTCAEIDRVLPPGGLLFLAENTAPKKDVAHFRFRGADEYQSLFQFAPLRILSMYDDLDEPITLFAGRKHAPS